MTYVLTWDFLSVYIQCVSNGVEVEASTSWQYIGSPNFPGYYPNDAHCKWTIRTPLASQSIIGKVIEFSLEESVDGCYDYLVVSNGKP